MKSLIAFIAALCIALPAAAAPKKEEGKGKDKDRKMEKETPAQMWSVVVEGATGETAAQDVKAFLSLIRGVKVESSVKKDDTVEVVLSSKSRVTRSDVSRALRERKELKVKEFKSKRPDKETDQKDPDKKTDDPKKEEPKKDGDKTEPKKEGDKTEVPKGQGGKTGEPKKEGETTEPKKETKNP
jgi:hypothetical protein